MADRKPLARYRDVEGALARGLFCPTPLPGTLPKRLWCRSRLVVLAPCLNYRAKGRNGKGIEPTNLLRLAYPMRRRERPLTPVEIGW